MGWKLSEALAVSALLAAVVWWRLPSGQSEPTAVSAASIGADQPASISMPDVEASAQSLMVSIGTMIECRLEGIVPMAAANRYGDHLKARDRAAFERGAQKAVLMLKGLALKPGSQTCAAAKPELQKNAVLYQALAAAIP